MGRPSALVTLCQAILALSPALGQEDGWKQKQKEDGRVVQELKIEAPTMTEEDQYGHVMPERYRCDSCRAVMFHVALEMGKKHPKSRRMKQWEYTDVFDETCRSGFEGYGIKLVNGENKLSGPALRDDDALAPGMGAIQMGGESWNKRLGEICRKTIYEKVGEEEFYEQYYEQRAATSDDAAATSKALVQAFCYSELKECRTGPDLPPPAKDKDSSEKTDKAKAAKAKAKKEKKAKAKAEAEAKAARKADASGATATGGSEEKLDVQAFLRNLAVKHGLTSDEYLAARSAKEWEKLTVAIAGRIFNGKSDEL